VRLTTARRLRETPVDCARWAGTEATGSLDDLEHAQLERSSAFIRGTGYESPAQTFERAAELLRAYRLFPPELVETTVCAPDDRLIPGAVVVQRSFMGALAVESAVRVEEIVDEPTFAGRRFAISFVTLRGHPLRGAETIELLMHETGRIELHFTSASWPAGVLARLGGPITRWMQQRANRQALAYFRSLVADTGPRAEPPSLRNVERLTLWETSEIGETRTTDAVSTTMRTQAPVRPGPVGASSTPPAVDRPERGTRVQPMGATESQGEEVAPASSPAPVPESTGAARPDPLAEDQPFDMDADEPSRRRMEVSS
jgi:uncharacterized protein (UPF0548 family)